MRTTKLTLLIGFIFFLSSGTNRNTSFIVTVKKHFNIELPDYFYEMKGLNDDALLEYGYSIDVDDEKEECYFMIFNETYKSLEKVSKIVQYDCESYLKATAKNIKKNMEAATVEYLQEDPISINGLDFMSCEIEGNWDDLELYYQMGVIEGEKEFYRMVAWTPLHMKGDLKEDISAMLKSFKEI